MIAKRRQWTFRRKLPSHMAYGIWLSRHMIGKRPWQFGLYGRISKKKPFVALQKWRQPLALARAHVDWTPAQWSQVLFSEEKKFNRIGSDGRIYVRRRTGETYASQCLRPTVKGGGGSIMVWGSFSSSGTGPIHRIEGIMEAQKYEAIMKAQKYEAIMEDVMLPYAEDNLPLNWTFQQDNDPKHRARRLQQWFERNRIRLLDWPFQSPDLNPFENLWADVQRDVQAKKPRNLNELLQCIQES
uniref:Tc1-like transposase DDE domain-containing protein n=1 Tax=Plectus sambesii TaxID=2011161 RepID=A0A914WM74_9BILA